jgi:hypothetical protein
MTPTPRWSEDELTQDSVISARQFRAARLSPSPAWLEQCGKAQQKFKALFENLGDWDPDKCRDVSNLSRAYKENLGEALRYLAGPPISDDDLRVIAEVNSLAPGVLSRDNAALAKVFGVIERIIDPFRFPWVVEHRAPTPKEKNAALLASSVLLAAQRIATDRRNEGKVEQEERVKNYLRSLNLKESPTETITTIVKGPQTQQFSGECLLGERKADIVLRLHDTRLMAIECKVSNSAINSVKRINNDAAAKAEYWLKTFGTSQVVPAAMLSGVFNIRNLLQAQQRGLTLFWSHDLEKLGRFIAATQE